MTEYLRKMFTLYKRIASFLHTACYCFVNLNEIIYSFTLIGQNQKPHFITGKTAFLSLSNSFSILCLECFHFLLRGVTNAKI